MEQQQRAFPIVVLGHVDHGKSTLIGRLLHDTGSLPDGKVELLRAVSEKRGLEFEWSFLLDSLQIERDQGITVDISQTWFSTTSRRYVVIDAPGHTEFLKNMVSGAAKADGAVLVVDATQGVGEQTRRHAYLMNLLGLNQVLVVINKMDAVGNDEARFNAVAGEIGAYLASIGQKPSAIIPISARHGANITTPAEATPWYNGPTLLQALDAFVPKPAAVEQPLRLPVQDVYRLDDRRIVVGRIESGRLRVGDALRFTPGGRVVKVLGIETWNRDVPQIAATAGESVALRLDEELFVERGALASHVERPLPEGQRLHVRLFWLGREPLVEGQRLKLRLATAEHDVMLERVERVIDVADLGHLAATQIERNGVAEAVLRARSLISADAFADAPATGRGVLLQGGRVVGGFTVTRVESIGQGRNITRVATSVTPEERAAVNGHRGLVLWLTGLSGAGKSTLAMNVQRRLFEQGRQVVVLDGDNLRQGLNKDLGFSPADRAENVRRTAEVARLFAETGHVAIVALISPFAADRARARETIGEDFIEVHIHADLAACIARDPKGLYAKAKSGEIAGFTGISATYEPPVQPDAVIDTSALSLEAASAELLATVEQRLQLRAHHKSLAG